MDTPHQAGDRPIVLELEAGNYAWCACGLSKNQPFCDGTHKGTGFSPLRITLEEPKRCAFCACKQSKNGAFCDGTHKALSQ